MKSKITQFADGFRPNILHSGVRVSFYVFHFTYCQVPGNVPGGYSEVFRGCSREYSGPVPECSEMPLYSPQWQLL